MSLQTKRGVKRWGGRGNRDADEKKRKEGRGGAKG